VSGIAILYLTARAASRVAQIREPGTNQCTSACADHELDRGRDDQLAARRAGWREEREQRECREP
jgi:hypothetical protein